jgi:hypothetical protein
VAPVLLETAGRTALLAPVAEDPLTEQEAAYVAAARSANTLRGYRSDWAHFTAWCRDRAHVPLPAGPVALTGYLTELAGRGHAVGTLSTEVEQMARSPK